MLLPAFPSSRCSLLSLSLSPLRARPRSRRSPPHASSLLPFTRNTRPAPDLAPLSSVRALELSVPHGIELSYAVAVDGADTDEPAPQHSAASSEAVYNGLAPPADVLPTSSGHGRLRRSGPGVRVARLVLRADSEAERRRWVDGLQARMRWQAACASSHAYQARPAPQAAAVSAATSATADEDAVSAPAIGAATIAAKRAAARAESAAVAADICIAMGATERPLRGGGGGGNGGNGGNGNSGGGGGMPRGGGRHGASHPDLDAFLLQRQKEVWAELEAEGFCTSEGGYAKRPPSAATTAATSVSAAAAACGEGDGTVRGANAPPQPRLVGGDEAESSSHEREEASDGVDTDSAEGGVIDLSDWQQEEAPPRPRPPPPRTPTAAAVGNGRRRPERMNERVPRGGGLPGGGGGPPEPTAAGLQMLVALGATPLVVEGAAGSAKVASQLATFVPPEQVAAVHAAWGAS